MVKKLPQTLYGSRQAVRPTIGRRIASTFKAGGQALVEYVLIIALVTLMAGLALAITGPAIANTFTNTFANLLKLTLTPYTTQSAEEFDLYLTAVASYTPPAREVGGGINPPPDTSCAVVACTNTPVRTATDMPTIGPSPTRTFTPTFARGATATDSQFPVGRNNPDDASRVPIRWDFDNTSVLKGYPWNVKYYNGASIGNLEPGAPAAETTVTDVDFNYGTGSPRSGVNADNFSAIFTLSNVVWDGFTYEIRVTGNNYAEVLIGGSYVTGIIEANPDAIATQVFTYRAPDATPRNVQVRFLEQTGSAEIHLSVNRATNGGTCSWGIQQTKFKSSADAYADSPVGNYALNSACTMRLQGFYNLADVAGTSPHMTFFEQWDLGAGDQLRIGVREYTTTAVSEWAWENIHDTASLNRNWQRAELDLTSVGPSNTNFTGRRVEIAFQVRSDGVGTKDGWYLDDIVIENNAPPNFHMVGGVTPPFLDDNATTMANWIGECGWQVRPDTAAPSAQETFGTGPYIADDKCELRLDGFVDLTDVTIASGTIPELSFHSRIDLKGTTDVVRVQFAPELDPNNWQNLELRGEDREYIYQGATVRGWERLTVNLSNYNNSGGDLRQTRFRLRFYLDADLDTNVGGSWSLDNIRVAARVLDVRELPYFESFDTLGDWDAAAPWGRTTGTDPTRGTGAALTDSPNGANYAASGSATILMRPQVRIGDTASAINPVLTFSTRWNAPTANLVVQASTDDGTTWSDIWTHAAAAPDGRQDGWERITVDLSPQQTATEKVKVRFVITGTGGAPADGWYIDDVAISDGFGTPFEIATTPFVDALDNAGVIDANWYAGSTWKAVTNGGRTGGNGAMEDSPTANYLPFARSRLESIRSFDLTGTTKPALYFWTKYDLDTAHGFDVKVLSANQFDWENAAVLTRSLKRTVSDSAAVTAINLGWHRWMIPLDAPLVSPIRVAFEIDAVSSPATTLAGVSIDQIEIMDRADLTVLNPATTGLVNDSFVDLSKWVAEGNWQQVTGSPSVTAYGVWSHRPGGLRAIADTYALEPSGTRSTSNWVGTWWHVPPTNTATWGSPAGQVVTIPGNSSAKFVAQDYLDINKLTTVGATDFPFPAANVAWQEAGTNANEHYIARFQRTLSPTVSGSLLIRVNYTGGVRIRVNGQPLAPSTTLPRPYINKPSLPADPFSNASDPTAFTLYYQLPVSALSNYAFNIEYFHTTNAAHGAALLDVQFALSGTTAHTNNPNPVNVIDSPTLYARKHVTALQSNGVFEIKPNETGYVRYHDRHSITDNATLKVYYSLDLGDTWVLAPTAAAVNHVTDNNPQGSWTGPVNPDADWTARALDIPALATAQKVMLRFELNSLAATLPTTQPTTDDGWWLDNFIFASGTTPPGEVTGTIPTSSTFTVITTVNTAVTAAPNTLPVSGTGYTYLGRIPGATRGSVTYGPGQLTYNPIPGWTGIDQFTYTAVNADGETVQGIAQVTVNPTFARAVNLGGPAVTDGSITFEDGTTAPGVDEVNGTYLTNLTTSTGSATATQETLLRSYYQANAANGFEIDVKDQGGLNFSTGIYSVYLWTWEEGPQQNVNYYIEGQRFTRVTQLTGQWNRLGPYVVKVADGDVTINGAQNQIGLGGNGDIANISAVEIYRGAAVSPSTWTFADIMGYDAAVPASDDFGPDNGVSSVTATTFNITNSRGYDIWNTADGMSYLYKPEAGDMEVTVRLDNPNFAYAGVDQWTKGGLMFRSSTDPRSSFFAIMVTPNTGGSAGRALDIQFRTGNGVAASKPAGTDGAVATLPTGINLKIVKQADNFTAYYKADADINWTQIGTGSYAVSMGTNYLVGIGLTSHNQGAAFTMSGNLPVIVQR